MTHSRDRVSPSTRGFAAAALTLLFGASPAVSVVTLQVGSAGSGPAFPHANGRQIVRTGDGLWLVAYDARAGGRSSIRIAVSRGPDPGLAGDFAPPVLVAGGDGAAIPDAAQPRKVAMAVDGKNLLHLVWEDGDSVWYARANVRGREPVAVAGRLRHWLRSDGATPGAERLPPSTAGAALGDIALDPQGRVWIAYTVAVPVPARYSYPFMEAGVAYRQALRSGTGHEIWAASPGEHGWRRRRLTVAGPATAPVVDLDRTGTLHLAFPGTRSHLYYLQVPRFAADAAGAGEDLTATAPTSVWSGTDYAGCSVVGWGARALVVFEKLEHVNLYAYYDGKEWTTGPITAAGREVHRNPILTRDEHDVAWVFWANLSRGHTFYARWLGSRFSAPYTGRTVIEGEAAAGEKLAGPNAGPFHSVQRLIAPGSDAIGVALTGEAVGGVYFDRVRVPGLRVEKDRKVIFLDMLEVAALDGVKEAFHPMTKHPANPVLAVGAPGSWDDRRAHAYGEVLYDGGKFRMWYSGWDGVEAAAQSGGSTGHHVGYAESEDGVRWTRPVLGQLEYQGSRANNIIDLGEGGGHAYMPMVVKDERDPDPGRRYKLIVERSGKDGLHYSADGIHWGPGVKVLETGWSDRRSFFFDALEPDPVKRWKVYSHCGARAPASLRKTCRDWSPDAIHWTSDPRNPVMHPRAGLAIEQHMISIWIDAGMYVGMFDAWQPTQVQPQQLVASRDGVNFVHVFDGTPVIALGAAGSWDAGWTSPINVPVRYGDELRMYYSGGPETIGPNGTAWRRRPMQTGLATVRRDGFVSLDVAEGRTRGAVETVPLRSTGIPLRLEVNADGLGGGRGRITVEVVSGAEVLAASRPVVDDGVRRSVEWPAGSAIALPDAPVRLRFRLEGAARLYSFTFV